MFLTRLLWHSHLFRPSRIYSNHASLHNTVVQCLTDTISSFVCTTCISRSILNRHQRDRLRAVCGIHLCPPCCSTSGLWLSAFLRFSCRGQRVKLVDRTLSARDERMAKGTPMQRFVTTFSNCTCNCTTETFECAARRYPP